MKSTSLILTGYNSAAHMDRLKVAGGRLLVYFGIQFSA